MSLLSKLGLLLEGIGVIVALYGVHVRFREIVGPGPHEWDPLVAWLRATWNDLRRRVTALLRRLLRRPAPIQHVTGSGSFVQGAMTLRARGRVGFAPLEVSDHETALNELARRTQELGDRIADVRDRGEDEVERLDRTDTEIRERLESAVSGLRDETERVAMVDVRLQLVGLLIVGVGIILQAAAIFFGW